MGSVLVAFSGGTDSAFLAAVAQRVLGSKTLAVTAVSPSVPRRELEEARRLAARIGIRHREVETGEMDIEAFTRNAPDRCYHCKTELFGLLRRIADEEKLVVVVDGSNLDDTGDYRPGSAAAREHGVRSPLQEAGFTKADIRAVSREMGLPTAEKPASACLASRIPYGTPIREETLGAVERAEGALRDLGFEHVRVRAHGEIARVEVPPADIARIAGAAVRDRVVAAVKASGFRYIALDLQGYRTGSLNEALGGWGV